MDTLVAEQVPVPEIIWFTPSEEYQADPRGFLVPIHSAGMRDSVLGMYYGFHLEDTRTAVLVVGWRSQEHQQLFMESESYLDDVLPFIETIVGPGNLTQIVIPPDPRCLKSLPDTIPPLAPCISPSSSADDFCLALSSPFTQFMSLTSRRSRSQCSELNALVDTFAGELKFVPSCSASCWGPAISFGKENVIVGIIGWESQQDYKRESRPGGRLASILSRIREVAVVEMNFARMNQHM
ncbi:hypothetical protein AX16_008038 [Volvariella volvacea WC 439]|nr:hypothetical protein AX16_008038 [Volvariella volvacea WC 439]